MSELPHWVTCVITNKKNQILILKRYSHTVIYPGYWSFVAGGLEESDVTDIFAMRREIEEELSLKLDVKKVTEFELDQEGRKSYLHLFAATFPEDSEIKLNFENIDFAWVDPGKLGQYKLVPEMESVLNKVLFTSFAVKAH